MADRGGQQPEEDPPLGGLILRGPPGVPERIEIADGPVDAGPEPLKQLAIPGVTEVLRHDMNELAVAVVLRDRIGGPRRSTQQGTFPLAYWKPAYQRMNSRTTSAWPKRSSAAPVSAPSRIQERW